MTSEVRGSYWATQAGMLQCNAGSWGNVKLSNGCKVMIVWSDEMALLSGLSFVRVEGNLR